MSNEKQKYYKAKIAPEGDGKIYHKSEMIEGFQDVKLPKKSFFGNGDFVTIFQAALKEIVLSRTLNKNEMILLIYLIATTGKDNSVCLDLNIISEDLNIAKSNVSTALRTLVERNIIIRKDGYRYRVEPLPMQLSVNYDQFNYDLAYAGKVSQYKKVKHSHPEIVDDKEKKLAKYAQISILDQIRDAENGED